MRVLTCVAPGQLTYGEAPKPENKSGHAILRIKRVGICGTDLHAFEGTQPYFTYPRILGHELSGEITAYDGDDFKVGEQVTVLPYFACSKCVACRNGKPNCCVDLKVCGVHIDGGMVDYFQVPAESLVHARGLDLESLALVEPLAIGAHAVRRAAIAPGEFVLVVGVGPIGLGIIEFAVQSGAKVIALDVNAARLARCSRNPGVLHMINASTGNVKEQLAEITNNDMPAVVIDATGNRGAINSAFQFMSHGGRYILVGLQKGTIEVLHPEFHKREGTLMSSRNATREDFDHVITKLSQGMIKPDQFITHRVSFDKIKDEFPRWLDPNAGVIKAMVTVN